MIKAELPNSWKLTPNKGPVNFRGLSQLEITSNWDTKQGDGFTEMQWSGQY